MKTAIERAFASGKPSVVNVVAGPYAKAKTRAFGSYSSRLDRGGYRNQRWTTARTVT